MGESNAVRVRRPLMRLATARRAAEIYAEKFGTEDGALPATYQARPLIRPRTCTAGHALQGCCRASSRAVWLVSVSPPLQAFCNNASVVMEEEGTQREQGMRAVESMTMDQGIDLKILLFV